MPQKLVGLVLVSLFFVSAGVAETRPGMGQLQVSATVVSSSQLVEQTDGSFRLLLANSPGQTDLRDLQLAIHRLDATSRDDLQQNKMSVRPLLQTQTSNHKRNGSR